MLIALMRSLTAYTGADGQEVYTVICAFCTWLLQQPHHVPLSRGVSPFPMLTKNKLH